MPSDQTSGRTLTIDALVLTELMDAGNQLVEATEQHWDEIPLAVVLARWEDALFAAGKAARLGDIGRRLDAAEDAGLMSEPGRRACATDGEACIDCGSFYGAMEPVGVYQGCLVFAHVAGSGACAATNREVDR